MKMRRWLSIDRFAFYNGLAIVLGGLLAAVFMQPEMDFGPVRASTYLIFFVASIMLAQRYISIVRMSEDGKATLFVVASCWWWVSFATTSIMIEYLIAARAFGLWPTWSESTIERFSYFFISGSAIGVLFKAVTFRIIPKEMLMGQRVSAWPFNLFSRNGKRKPYGADDKPSQGDREKAMDARDIAQDVRGVEQDVRGVEQDVRGVGQDDRGIEQDFNGRKRYNGEEGKRDSEEE